MDAGLAGVSDRVPCPPGPQLSSSEQGWDPSSSRLPTSEGPPASLPQAGLTVHDNARPLEADQGCGGVTPKLGKAEVAGSTPTFHSSKRSDFEEHFTRSLRGSLELNAASSS